MSFELVAAEGVEEHEWKRAYNLRKCDGENVTVTKRNSADEDVSFTRFEPHDFISNDEVRHPAYYIEKGNSRQCVNAESVKGIVSMVRERTRRYGTEAWRGPWGGEIKGAVPREFDNPDLALIDKAFHGPVWFFQLLLHLGANPNTRDERSPKGLTPLVEAIKGILYNSYDSESKVSLLLQNGADVEFTDGKGVTPLMAAVNAGNENIVRTLLDNGADPEKSVGKLAPLSLAAKKGHYRVVKVLLEKGAEVEKKTGGLTPLSHAVREGEHATVRTLLDVGKANANAKTKYGLTPLIIAAKKGLYSIAQTLLSGGAYVDGTDKDGMTPLMYAVKHGHADVVRMLLDKGADVKKKDDLRKRERSWLVDNKKDVYEYTRFHHRDGNFGTAFMYAARYWNGDRTIVDTLLEKGSDVNETDDRDKKTPLSLAAVYGYVKLIQILLDKGAKIEIADQAKIPLLGYAAVGNDENIVRELLNRGADVTKKGADGATPLMHAMVRPDHAITRLLLENGADVNDKDAKWFSPLTVAVGTWPYADHKTLQTLLDHGANVLAKDVHGRTALMHIVGGSSDLTAALMMLEFEMNNNGSNVSKLVNVQDGKFKTALDYCPTYRIEMRRLLLDFGAEEGGIRKSTRTRGNDVEHSELPDDHQEDEWEDGFDNEELFAVTSSETAEEARLAYDEFLTDLGIELGIEPGRKELRKLIKKKK